MATIGTSLDRDLKSLRFDKKTLALSFLHIGIALAFRGFFHAVGCNSESKMPALRCCKRLRKSGMDFEIYELVRAKLNVWKV